MYNNRNKSSRHYGGGSRNGGYSGGRGRSGGYGGGGRGFRIKYFDPTRIIENVPELVVEEVYETSNKFSDFSISEKIKSNVESCGYTIPTPIQDQAIPEILAGKDVVGVAHTGTGKTAAFLIPLIDKVMKNKGEKVLIVTPTRELAVQIEKELWTLTKGTDISSVVCIGGVSISAQINRLRHQPSFVIGTPGRLIDLTERHVLRLSDYSSIVLDEVDRMLDMGFIYDVQKIISKLPEKRHSLFFSATMSGSVLAIMKQFTKEPVVISVKSQDSKVDVEQSLIKMKGRLKLDVLRELLDQKDYSKVLIFGRTKRGVEKLESELDRMKFMVSAIHGNKTQNQRQRALDMFKDGKINILVATDVVARGIDVRDISHVINYELPETYEDYLHRIGRTGRAGKKGKAITFTE